MSIFTNPVRGMMGNVGADMTARAHFKRFPARDLRIESMQMFRDMGAATKLFKEFERDMEGGLLKEIGKDEEKLIEVSEHICEEIRQSLRDIVMIGHFQLEMLRRLLVADEGIIKKGFPRARGIDLERRVQEKIKKTHDVLKNAGNTLLGPK